MNSATAAKDPVCGMEVDTAADAGRSDYQGQRYYFCGPKCKEKFGVNPEQYLDQPAGTQKSSHGCCS